MKINWGTSILIFLILFITLSIIFVIFSLQQNNDLVEDDYYEQGANYTQIMSEKQRSNTFTDSLSITNNDSNVIIKVTKHLAISLNTTPATIQFYKPSDKKADFITTANFIGDSMAINKNKLVHGRYMLHVTWIINNLSYKIEKDLFVNKP